MFLVKRTTQKDLKGSFRKGHRKGREKDREKDIVNGPIAADCIVLAARTEPYEL